jgi:hypothetical protein
MVRHSVVAYRNDTASGLQDVDFDGDAWLGYVPIQMADTICVLDRLPPGAAAVLIKQTHVYKDLFCQLGQRKSSRSVLLMGTAASAGLWKERYHLRPERISKCRVPFLNSSGGMIKSCSTHHGSEHVPRLSAVQKIRSRSFWKTMLAKSHKSGLRRASLGNRFEE